MPRLPVLQFVVRWVELSMIRTLRHLGWVSCLYMSPPALAPEPADPPGREPRSGAPMSPLEREIWADLLR